MYLSKSNAQTNSRRWCLANKRSGFLGLSTVPHTTRTYGAVNTVPVPRPVTSEPRSDHTRRNLWWVLYGTVLFTAVTGGIRWIQCHHFTMKTRIKQMIRILPVLYGHGQIRNMIEACVPSDFQVLHIYLIPHTPRAQVCFTGDCDTTWHLRRDAILPTRLTQIGKLWQHIKLLTLYISRSDSESRWLTRIDNGMTAAESVIPGYMLVRMPWGWQSWFNHDSGTNYVTWMVMSTFFRRHRKNFSFLSISLHSYQFAGRS